MEDSKKILEEICNTRQEKYEHIDLEFLDQKYTIRSLTNNGSFYNELCSDINRVFNKENFGSYNFSYKENTKFITSVLKYCLNLGSVEQKDKALLVVYALDRGYFLLKYLKEADFFDSEFIQYLESLIEKLNYISSSTAKENDWEFQAYENYKLGLKENKPKYILEFLSAFYRGYGGCLREGLIQYIIKILYYCNLDSVANKLNTISCGISFNILTSCLELEEKVLFLSNKNFNNTNLVLCGVYDIVQLKTDISDSQKQNWQKVFHKLDIDDEYFASIIRYFLGPILAYQSFFKPLGFYLEITDSNSLDVFVRQISLNTHYSEDVSKVFISLYNAIDDDNKQLKLSEKLYYKWSEFIDSYNDYAGNIILTDIFNIIVLYSQQKEASEIKGFINQSLFAIDNIDTEWFNCTTKKTTFLFKELSKIFIFFSNIVKNKNDFVEELEKLNLIIKLYESELNKPIVLGGKTSLTLLKESFEL